MINIQDFIDFFDCNAFISDECLAILSTLDHPEGLLHVNALPVYTHVCCLSDHTRPIELLVRISSSNREQRFSYAIGRTCLTANISWLELEQICLQIFTDHIIQIDSPFDYAKSSTGCQSNQIDSFTLGKRHRLFVVDRR
jgi:hypothetical protein